MDNYIIKHDQVFKITLNDKPLGCIALLSAFSLATSDALSKKELQGNNEYLIAWFRLIFTLPLGKKSLFWEAQGSS